MNSKIKNQKEIVRIIGKLKKQGKIIVACNGSFDILHVGHIRVLKEAKNQGDFLIVMLNSDESVRSYKGPKRPIICQKERAEILSALECIDFIVIFDEITPKEILKKIKPDIYCHDLDWGKDFIERETIKQNKGRVYFFKSHANSSTSQLVQKILEVYSTPEIKAVFLDRDGTININKPEYVNKIKDFKFASGVIPALQKLSKTGYKIIIATDQSGVGRGYFKENDLKKLHQWMLRELKKKGIRIDKIYYCPHQAKDNCSCRKPKIGMVLKAVKDFGINLSKSWIVGDDERDIIVGREANIKTIKIGGKMSKNLNLESNYYVKNLLGAVKIILS
ncbi:D-glycero-beta-D-manno-heptose 1,7-bisphosphate 7-phosphatase [Patescibacteria group bacterium]|nr:D-glycero-beta-D-manno-heptose 1,7-bisphosphate 7-phosphatase [Patescibacteria group bacterium]